MAALLANAALQLISGALNDSQIENAGACPDEQEQQQPEKPEDRRRRAQRASGLQHYIPAASVNSRAAKRAKRTSTSTDGPPPLSPHRQEKGRQMALHRQVYPARVIPPLFPRTNSTFKIPDWPSILRNLPEWDELEWKTPLLDNLFTSFDNDCPTPPPSSATTAYTTASIGRASTTAAPTPPAVGSDVSPLSLTARCYPPFSPGLGKLVAHLCSDLGCASRTVQTRREVATHWLPLASRALGGEKIDINQVMNYARNQLRNGINSRSKERIAAMERWREWVEKMEAGEGDMKLEV